MVNDSVLLLIIERLPSSLLNHIDGRAVAIIFYYAILLTWPFHAVTLQ